MWLRQTIRALVVGIAAYKNGRVLKNAVNDAREIKKLLESRGVHVLYAENVNIKEFDDIVDKFVQTLQEQDAAIVFFAGHGCVYNNATRLMAISESPNSDFLRKESVNALVLLDRFVWVI